MAQSRLEYLFERYVNQTANPQEEKEFFELAELPENKERVQQLLDQFIKEAKPENAPSAVTEDAILQAILKAEPRVVRIKRSLPWLKMAVAAATIGLLALGIWFFTRETANGNHETIAQNKVQDVAPPKSTRATITLANGQQIVLDSAGAGTLAVQGDVKIIKNGEGGVRYESEGDPSHSPDMASYNTLFNPRGSKVVNLTLNDGTKVWLNSESSLKYPTAFASGERKVEITGEAYFEVNPHPLKGGEKMPFLVQANGVTTEVLGTHFNVNAYKDDGDVKVTLLEGSVNVERETSNVKLKPGQQAIAASSELRVVSDVDTDAVMAWKNGQFSFTRADIKTVMRELARWYDLEVEYKGKPTTDLFGGDIQRDLPLSKVLRFLEKSQIHFNIEGKKVIVTP